MRVVRRIEKIGELARRTCAGFLWFVAVLLTG